MPRLLSPDDCFAPHLGPTKLLLSASDLVDHALCPTKFSLQMLVARRCIPREHSPDPLADLLREKGLRHEDAYVEFLRAQGREVLSIPAGGDQPGITPNAVAATLEAMRAGADIITQAALVMPSQHHQHLAWGGRIDLLQRVNLADGRFRYEAADTKLSAETKPAAVLQLLLYAELVAHAERDWLGLTGEHESRVHVVPPGFVAQSYRIAEYAAVLRWLMRRAELSSQRSSSEVQASLTVAPEPVPHCDTCSWWRRCDRERHEQDHLSLIADITRSQRRELRAHGYTKVVEVAGLAQAGAAREAGALPFDLQRGSIDTYRRLIDQAALQVASRGHEVPRHHHLARVPSKGLGDLPEPTANDIFLDFEGDVNAEDGPLEYLFGWIDSKGYHAHWGLDREAEAVALDHFLDAVEAALEASPGAHIFHYGDYENAALKRLIQRNPSRRALHSRLLREGRLVNLLAVVKQALQVGVESYSIKQLEPLFGLVRQLDLRKASLALRGIERALGFGTLDAIDSALKAEVESYNEDDCRSTVLLRNWLEAERDGLIKRGESLDRRGLPVLAEEKPEVPERARRRLAVSEHLRALAVTTRARGEELAVTLDLLADIVGYFEREAAAKAFEFYRMLEAEEDELREHREAIVGLAFEGLDGTAPKGGRIERYSFEGQLVDIREGDSLVMALVGRDADGRTRNWAFGTVVSVDAEERLLVVQRPAPSDAPTTDEGASGNAASTCDDPPRACIKSDWISTEKLEDSLLSVCEDIAAKTEAALAGEAALTGGAAFNLASFATGSVAASLLLRLAPCTTDGAPLLGRSDLPPHDLPPHELAPQVLQKMAPGVLAIQGPPGTGKTYTGVQIILALLAAGKRVGVVANSHAVIDNLLERTLQAAGPAGVSVSAGKVVSRKPKIAGAIVPLSTKQAPEKLAQGEVNLLGGTSWLWSREEMKASVDVLVVDEAGQLSLAMVLASAGAAEKLVLLGDPQQLQQPLLATHPNNSGVSALRHLMGEHSALPADMGFFLGTTWRLAPAICQLTSELFYEGALKSASGCEHNRVVGADGRVDKGDELTGSGLRFVATPHEGNASRSVEEAKVVVALCQRLLVGKDGGTVGGGDGGGYLWQDRELVEGGHSPSAFRPEDILIVTPFNAQIVELRRALARASEEGMPGLRDVRVGTVDKFQGQEAAVVIYSMASSSLAESPRGMGFLFDLNRFNVATSRAKCLCIMVASPALFGDGSSEREESSEPAPGCGAVEQLRLVSAHWRYMELAGVV